MANTSALQSDLATAFTKVGLKKIDGPTLARCAGIASGLRMSAEKVALCWEAHSINKNVNTLNEQNFEAFRNTLVKEDDGKPIMTPSSSGAVLPPKTRSAPLPHVTPPAKRLQTMASSSQRKPKGTVVTSLQGSNSGRVSLSPGPPVDLTSPSDKYDGRKDAGSVVASYTPDSLEPAVFATLPRRKCTLSMDFETNVREPYRHLFTTAEQRSKALNQFMDDTGNRIVETHHLGHAAEEVANSNENTIAPLEGVGIPRPDKVCCIGRICNAAHQGKINATSVLLEGGRESSGGARIEVDFSQLRQNKTAFSVFPGQIVAMEGMNPSGRKLQVHRLCEGAAYAPEQTSIQQLEELHYQKQDGQPLKLFTAAGPFTLSDSFTYQPLQDLLHVVKRDKPDVVILMGPFVDMEHKGVKSGQTTLQDEDGNDILVPYETFFMNKISPLLEDLYEREPDLMTQFVLVPSLQDASAEWVYPQPPLQDRIAGGMEMDLPGGEGIAIGTLGLDFINSSSTVGRRVHCVPNPCTLKINETVVGITSTDVLFHLTKGEYSENLAPGTRLQRLSQHLVQQGSYYPLFPPDPTMNLDLQHMDKWRMPCQPDILLIPSKLKTFVAPVLEDTLVINPGRLTRERLGGTYAMAEIHPLSSKRLEQAQGDDTDLRHSIPKRTKVEVRRI